MPPNLNPRCARQNASPGLRPLRDRSQPRWRSTAATGSRRQRSATSKDRSTCVAAAEPWRGCDRQRSCRQT
ncbi:hypothetical protein PCL1606_30960 [Pseudomonas chlororaphis]|uniref:Uncharacterized protein n=1 Tax=Pseudomonas chlororaphis TaxID=587753 RepID=A0A0D5Y0M5_9PSED|nr:hypothetical protein PCL1606_30960 [Pseudomonas chlororaphis]